MAKKKAASKSAGSEVCCSPMTAADKKRQEEWQAEDDARSLQRAAEIRKDPARMKRVRAYVQKQLAALTAATK